MHAIFYNPLILRAIFVYLVAINVFTFCIYGIDKYKSQHARWSISESELLGFAEG